MKEAASAVITFNRDLLGIAPREIAPLSNAEFEHLKKCLHEEFSTELDTAFLAEDVVAMVDSILDGIYFAIGGLYKMGLTADQVHACFMHIHEKNMEKKAGKVARRAVEGAADAVKPENFVPPEVEITRILGLGE